MINPFLSSGDLIEDINSRPEKTGIEHLANIHFTNGWSNSAVLFLLV